MSKKQIVRLFKERWRTERAYEDLKGELGPRSLQRAALFLAGTITFPSSFAATRSSSLNGCGIFPPTVERPDQASPDRAVALSSISSGFVHHDTSSDRGLRLRSVAPASVRPAVDLATLHTDTLKPPHASGCASCACMINIR